METQVSYGRLAACCFQPRAVQCEALQLLLTTMDLCWSWSKDSWLFGLRILITRSCSLSVIPVGE